jgi:hypothetical protein
LRAVAARDESRSCSSVVAVDAAPVASLATLRRAAGRAWRRSREVFGLARSARVPFKRKPLFEALEPRVLLSADFHPVAPAGSMVYASTQTGVLASAGPDVSYTLSLDAGQKVSVALVAQDPALRASIRLLAPDGTLIGSADAAAAGQGAVLDSVAAANAGDYSLVFHNLDGAGNFTADTFLNATPEAEPITGAGNNDVASAQSLAPSELALPGGGLRYAAAGTTESGTADFYRLDLNAGDVASFGLASTQTGGGAALHLELQDGAGQLIALGDNAAHNLNQVIRDFVAPVTGPYNLKVSGNGGEQYTLVALRGAQMELEPNETPADANVVNPLDEVLGNLGSKGSGGIRVAVVGTGQFSYDSGFRGIVNQLNDDTYADFTATLITPADADTLQELQQYDAVVVGGARISTVEFAQYASALRAYEEAGGGVVATGWAIYSAQSLSGQARTDFDAAVPVNVSGSFDNYVYNTLFTPTGSHPVVVGVPAFYTGTYTQFPTASPALDAGATLLGTTNGFVAAAAGGIGAGRSVYLGPIYAGYYDGWGTGALRSGGADRLMEQAVAWAAHGGLDARDNYQVAVNAGDSLVIRTTTPADGTGAPANDLDPLLELYDPTGTLVASNSNGATDGRNALINYAVPTGASGSYLVRVNRFAGSGDYTLEVEGATGSVSSPVTVVAASLTDGITLPQFPSDITLTFSEPLDFSSLSAADLTVNNAPATALTVIDARHVRFDIGSLATGDGNYTVALAAGALQDLQGEGNTAFDLSFTLDTTGPTVVDSTLHDGDLYAPEPWSFAFTFDETLGSANLGAEDVVLHEALSNTDISANYFSYDSATHTVTVGFPALVEGDYTLTLLAGTYAFHDAVGNLLNDGANEVVHFSVDALSTAFPVPLTAQSPAGSLIHTGSVSGAFYQGGDYDDYTVALDANQTLSAVLRPVDPTFTGRIELYDPNGVWLGTYQAGAPGELAALNAVAASTAGEYTIRVTSNDEAGRYRIELTLNAALEQETLGWLDNSYSYLAESLDASVIDLGGARRAAVIGELPQVNIVAAQESFTLDGGEGGVADYPAWQVQNVSGNGFASIQTGGGRIDRGSAREIDAVRAHLALGADLEGRTLRKRIRQ